MSTKRYPGESPKYRQARKKLLTAEIALRKRVEAVAALRRELPLGGVVPEDYVFEEGAAELGDRKTARRVKLSQLFERGKDTLLLYNYMYSPEKKSPCPMCTAMLDGWNGTAPHLVQQVNLAIVARSPIARIRELARGRGWNNLRLLSSANNHYNRDYLGEESVAHQNPMLNVFVKRGKKIHHFWGSELLFAAPKDGLDTRHVDQFWPLWHLLDTTPAGRGDWYPALEY